MQIYLIRHTTPEVAKGICYGQTDLNLTSNFDNEASSVLEKIPKNIDLVFSSPLKRCLRLAQRIKTNVIIDERLKELDFGSWEMKFWDEIPQEEIKPWYNDWVNVSASKYGESYSELYVRSIEFMQYLKKEYKSSKKIAIVTHAGVIRAINAYVKKIDLKDSFNLKLNYGSTINFSINS